MGVKADVLPPDTDCHHFVLEVLRHFNWFAIYFFILDVPIHDSLILQDDWTNLEKPYGSIFLSIPTVLDSSLAPEGHHILHIFTTSSIEDWEVNSVHSLSVVGSNLFHIYVSFSFLWKLKYGPLSLLGTLSERLWSEERGCCWKDYKQTWKNTLPRA